MTIIIQIIYTYLGTQEMEDTHNRLYYNNNNNKLAVNIDSHKM